MLVGKWWRERWIKMSSNPGKSWIQCIFRSLRHSSKPMFVSWVNGALAPERAHVIPGARRAVVLMIMPKLVCLLAGAGCIGRRLELGPWPVMGTQERQLIGSTDAARPSRSLCISVFWEYAPWIREYPHFASIWTSVRRFFFPVRWYQIN